MELSNPSRRTSIALATKYKKAHCSWTRSPSGMQAGPRGMVRDDGPIGHEASGALLGFVRFGGGAWWPDLLALAAAAFSFAFLAAAAE